MDTSGIPLVQLWGLQGPSAGRHRNWVVSGDCDARCSGLYRCAVARRTASAIAPPLPAAAVISGTSSGAISTAISAHAAYVDVGLRCPGR